MSAIGDLRALAEAAAAENLKTEAKDYVEGFMKVCNSEAAKRLHAQVHRLVGPKRLAESVPALLMELSSLAASSAKPGVTMAAYKDLLEYFFNAALKEKDK